MKAALAKSLELRRKRPFQQFGQSNDARTNNGATGCTDTCLQFLLLLWKGKWMTHDQIRAKVGHTNRYTGLNYSEVQAFCRAMGLPYQVKLGLSATEIFSLSNRAPVMVGEAYSWHPERRGYVYMGIRADGKPNGFAEQSGKTQLKGFTGAHATVLLGYDHTDSDAPYDVYVFEPNHGSPSRPEKPPYDEISTTQFRNLYASYTKVLGRKSYALVPTKSL